ncbi:GMC oxidoreductase [Pseudomonas sp. R2.Fl]|nr:GMC oxidoreductase [Pseudomonas sp. R2.Fl]
MLIDYRHAAAPDDFDAHLCIVGAGPAGIAIARHYLDTAVRVCLLVGGGIAGDAETQDLYAGDSVGNPQLDPAASRLRAFGGSTNAWGGGCIPLSRMDLDARDWVPHSGWPISYAELEPHYARARDLLAIDGHDFEAGGFLSAPARRPPRFEGDRLVNRNFVLSPVFFGQAYRAELERAPNIQVVLHANVLELLSDAGGEHVHAARIGSLQGKRGQVRAHRYVLACGGIENARLLLLSSSSVPHGLGNGQDLVGRYFMDHPRGRLGTLHARAVTPLTRPYDRSGGKGPTPVFPELCLSEDAMRTHRMLSGRVRPVAVEGQVPRGIHAARRLRSALRKPRPDEGGSLEGQMSQALRFGTGDETPPPPQENLARLALQLAPGVGDLARGVFNRLTDRPIVPADHVDVVGYFEQAPNPDSRVRLGEDLDPLGQRRVTVDWRLTPLDWHTYRTATHLFGEDLARACGGRFQADAWLHDERAPQLQGTAHHMGTTRMSDDPADGVVDRNLRVHGVDNLHVAGSSVFPTGGWAFPTFTLVALSMRLAEHLRDCLFLL